MVKTKFKERVSEAIRKLIAAHGLLAIRYHSLYTPMQINGQWKWMDEMKGRFAQLLPTKIPDTAMRDLAKAMLKVKGVGRTTPQLTGRLPRSRR